MCAFFIFVVYKENEKYYFSLVDKLDSALSRRITEYLAEKFIY